MNKESVFLNRITSVAFVLILIELTIGGGGRLVAWGPISLRMVLFMSAILISFLHFIFGKKLPKEYVTLLLIYSVLLVTGLVIGILNGAQRRFWWEDVKPLMYFFILPFFYFAITGYYLMEKALGIIKISGILLSICFIVTLLLIHSQVIPFLSFYNHFIATEEFFFRGEITFFYKGFLFLCISLLFIFFSNMPGRWSWMVLEIIAILLTITRGLWFAVLTTFAFYYLTQMKKRAIIFVLCAGVILFAGSSLIAIASKFLDITQSTLSGKTASTPDVTLLGDRNYSDQGRTQQIKEVMKSVTATSFFVGHGFGNGVPSRPVHMEISYIEIFHKQGILGLAFWAFLFLIIYQKFAKAPKGNERNAFFYSCFFIFAQSLTNQYINNPIGMSMLLFCLVCLDKLRSTRDEGLPRRLDDQFESRLN